MVNLKVSPKYLYAILFTIAFIYSKSSFGKLTEGKFVSGLAATLTKAASNNPYIWVKDFLENVAIPNSILFGSLTMWGELLVALSLVVSLLFLFLTKNPSKLWFLVLGLGCFGAMFLNAVFYLALGYMSASTESLNLLMFFVEAVGLIFALNGYTNARSKN